MSTQGENRRQGLPGPPGIPGALVRHHIVHSAMTSYVPNLHDSCYVVSYDCVVCICRAFLGTQVSKAPRETKGLRGSRAREDGPDLQEK